jgi:branched-chain amino acid transport system permease protein
MLALLLCAVVCVPWLGSDYLFRAILIPWLILALAALGLNLLVGYCGQISLGAAALMGVGAYAAYNLVVHVPGLNFLIVLLLAGAAAAVVGSLFGAPSLRIKGLYLAVATLAAQFFLDWTFGRVKWLSNHASSGLVTPPPLEIFGVAIKTPVQQYLFLLAVVTVLTIAAKNLVRGQAGRTWMAIRDMDVAAEVIGISPARAKFTAFAVSSFYLGVAGALWGFVRLGSWQPDAFSIHLSLSLLFMIIIGGLGAIRGAFFGAAFITVLPIVLDQIPHWLRLPTSTAAIAHGVSMIFGALIVIFLIAEPHGLARLWAIGREKLRMWPFPY